MRLIRRALPAAALLSLVLVLVHGRENYYRYDGSGNNEQHPLWGAVNTPYVRLQTKQAYADGRSSPSGPDVSPRMVSWKLMGAGYPSNKARSSTLHSDLLTYIGQFFDHDFDMTLDNKEDWPIPIPKGDMYFDPDNTGNKTMGFSRSNYIIDSDGVRQQVNNITAYLDASVIYGSDDYKGRSLRALVGGLMRVDQDNNLPVNSDELEMANAANIHPLRQLRAAGDRRQNVNPQQLAITTVFVREHNRRARELAAKYPSWTDDQLYTRARQWTTAHLQAVCYNEYLPHLGLMLEAYSGYDAATNPSIDNFFATVAYRYGHSKVTDVIYRIDDDGKEISGGHLLLQYSYFNPTVALSAGIEPVLRGMMTHIEGVVEPRFVTAIQNHLFGLAGVNGTDLFARNLQRGRDHGIPGYNKCRKDLGLDPVTSWDEVTTDVELKGILAGVYGTPDKCDPYVCGLAEPKIKNSHFGELFYKSMEDQYRRIRNGDWWFYKNQQNNLFTADEMKDIEVTGFRDLILRNTNIKVLPDNIWQVDPDQPWPVKQQCTLEQQGKSASFKNGRYNVRWSPEQIAGEDYIRFALTVQGTGWVGLGIAQDSKAKMVGADIIIASVPATGAPRVDDFYATSLNTPMMDTNLGGQNNVELISASESNGITMVEFRRPLKASDKYDRAISLTTPMPVIYAWSSSSDSPQFHGPNVGSVMLDLSGGKSTDVTSSGNDDYDVARIHGILMGVAWALLFPMGAVFGRAINMEFIGNNGSVRMALLWGHMICQVVATALATASFVYAFVEFSDGVKVDTVPHSHAKYGIAIQAIMYLQLLTGFIRPHDAPAGEQQSVLRKVWEVVHHLIGRSLIFMAIINVAIGIYILSTKYNAPPKNWIALTGAAFVFAMVGQAYLDRCERQFIRAKAALLAPSKAKQEVVMEDKAGRKSSMIEATVR